MLTERLQAVSHDRHLQVRYSAEPRPVLGAVEPPPDELERYRQYAVQHNYGFEQVTRLAGNIGYLDLRMVFTPEFAGPHAVAAMTLLANTRALIIDLRHNGGGNPDMVALLCSFLLPRRHRCKSTRSISAMVSAPPSFGRSATCRVRAIWTSRRTCS